MAMSVRARAASAAGVLLALLAGALPASAAPSSYVALGDSYSSGTGTRSYINDGTDCMRSVYAYPSLIASAKGYALTFRACSGATVSDVTNTQLSALSTSTAYVTISVGGNDAGFANVLTECALPSWMSNCYGAINGARNVITNILPGRLATLYSQIRSRAPQANVTIVGYPRIFDGRDCSPFTWFSSTEMSRLNATADLLNSVLATRASAAGFSFANPTSRFVGHAVCDSSAWINGLSWPISESFHPNRTGHASGYTPTVSPYLTGSTVTVTKAVLRKAARSATALARADRRYAALDATITPEVFVMPDLHSPRALAAAKKAGVNVDDPASVNAADRTYAATQAAAAR